MGDNPLDDFEDIIPDWEDARARGSWPTIRRLPHRHRARSSRSRILSTPAGSGSCS